MRKRNPYFDHILMQVDYPMILYMNFSMFLLMS